MEPISTALGAGLAAYASKELLSKLLGPSAEYLGGEIKGLVEKCNINLGDIFTKAARKAGDLLDDNSQVNPRVLSAVVSDGRFCQDDILKEYYAGILVSSRSADGSNDIGMSHLATLKSLSVYQVRLHYLFYHEFHRVFKGEKVNLGLEGERLKRMLYIPATALDSALNSSGNFTETIAHATSGLVRQFLLDTNWTLGSASHLTSYVGVEINDGLIIGPTLQGMELFIWSNGKQGILTPDFLTSQPIDRTIQFPIPPGTTRVNVKV